MRTTLSWKVSLTSWAALMFLVPSSTWGAGLRKLHGHVPAVLPQLQPAGRLPASQRLDLAIGLPLRNREALTNLIEQLYDPSSTNFHRYLTPAQFTERFGPTAQDFQAVADFAKAGGLQVVGGYGDHVLLDVSGQVADIERCFHVAIRVYRHPTEDREFYAPDVEPSVKTNVPIQDIEGLSNYNLPRPMVHLRLNPGTPTSAVGTAPSGNYWGNDFRRAYLPGVTLDGSGQMVGLVQFDGFYSSDITSYENQAGIPNVPLQVVLLPGSSGFPTSDSNNVAEVSLDIEMVVSMATNLAKLFVFEGAHESDILASMVASNQIKQFSSSWGLGSPTPTLEGYLQQMAVQGQSFFQAAGDGDAWCGSALPFWPTDDPWVTSVGGTTLAMNGNGQSYAAEVVWNAGFLGATNAWPPNGGGWWGSGGGISTSYSIPTWQQGIDMTANGGSPTMRNFPDVALVADQVWVIFFNGRSDSFWGTSCAAPLWAGFMAMVNQQAANNGLPSVGFMNPALYTIGKGAHYASCFHDITVGNNTNSCSANQFYATTGYDLCTGWGTPRGAALISELTGYGTGYAGPIWVNFNGPCPGNGSYVTPFCTLDQGTNAVPSGGTLWIVGPNSASERPKIAKPMVIRAFTGPVTIGR